MIKRGLRAKYEYIQFHDIHISILCISSFNKFRASLEALQLELGTNGNPLSLDYSVCECLATPCWFKVVWERLWYYCFDMHLDYPTIPFPRERDELLVDLFLAYGATGARLQSLNRCRLALNMLFLSDIVSANGRHLQRHLLNPLTSDPPTSSYTFPRECPTASDWTEWAIFWGHYTSPGLYLRQPLGAWIASSHMAWEWFYNPASDVVEHKEGSTITIYELSQARRRTRSGQVYCAGEERTNAVPSGLPVTVERNPDGSITRKEVGPALAIRPTQPTDFWYFLRTWGGHWMWEEVVGDKEDLSWLVEAMRNGTAVLVTDGSFDRKRAPLVSGAGWVITCRTAQKFLRGSFYETSISASAYRGELLGLVALHTLALALAQFYSLEKAAGKMCCDNMGALGQSSKVSKRIRTGAKQADLLRAIRTIKSHALLHFQYEHVDSHMDRYKLWRYLTLEQQLNVDCDRQAKAAVHRSFLGAPTSRGEQLLPLEKAAVFVGGNKLTTDVAAEVRFCLGEGEARAFYTAPNTPEGQGRGWTPARFNAVDWEGISTCLDTKSEMYGLWLSKQVSGICATRSNVARIQDLLDDKCPNCLQPGETAGHLNLCPAEGRVLFFNECVEDLDKWLGQGDKTDPELAYWIPKYILMRGKRPFATLGPMSPSMMRVAQAQDLIGWREFMEGRITTEMRVIQRLHCATAPCRMNGDDWVKGLISRVLHISHGQWTFRNFTLHDQQRGYLRLKNREAVLAEIGVLLESDPADLPAESKFLLEIDYSSLLRSSFDRQSYWVRAMKAARQAGRRVATLQRNNGAGARRRQAKRASRRKETRATVDTTDIERQIYNDTVLVAGTSRSRPHPAAIEALNPCNKRLRHPD